MFPQVKEEFPDEVVPAMLPCPTCVTVTPILMVARRTSERNRLFHYSLCGCECCHQFGEFTFPPSGFSTSRRALADGWNKHVTEIKVRRRLQLEARQPAS